MLHLVVKDFDGTYFMVPVENLVSPPPEFAEFSYYGKTFRSVVPAPPSVEIIAKCDYDSDECHRILGWWRRVTEGPASDYKREGLLTFSDEASVGPLAERPVYGLWPSMIYPDALTLIATVTFICDLVGKEQPVSPITFAESISEEQKIEVEQALTPKGLATLKKYGVALAG